MAGASDKADHPQGGHSLSEMKAIDGEFCLVLDACTGQNGLVQARQFNEAVSLTGITITKLDGTARGGVLFAIAGELGLDPVLIERAARLMPVESNVSRLESVLGGPLRHRLDIHLPT